MNKNGTNNRSMTGIGGVAGYGKKLMVAGALMAALGMISITGCENLEAPPDDSYTFSSDKGIVHLAISGIAGAGVDRTAIPDFSGANLFYILSALSDGADPVSIPFGAGAVPPSLELPQGDWLVSVRGYKERAADENLLVAGEKRVTVLAGKAQSLAIGLSPARLEEGAGTFKYTVVFPTDSGYPADMVQATLYLFNITGEDPLRAVDVWGPAVSISTGKRTGGTTSLPAGYYYLTIQASRKDSGTVKYTGRDEILCVYNNLETPVEYILEAADFAAAGTGTRTKTFDIGTGILGSGVGALQGLLPTYPHNTPNAPYFFALTGAVGSGATPMGVANNPLLNLYTVLEGRYVAYDLSALTAVTNANLSFTSTANDSLARPNRDLIVSVKLPATATAIGNYAFTNATGLAQVVWPAAVATIGTYAFSNTGLTSVTLPLNSSAQPTIGTYAFADNARLASVTIPAEYTSLPNYMFRNCTALEEIAIPPNVVTLGTSVFNGCTSLTRVDLSNNNFTSITDGVFANCSSLDLSQADIDKLYPSSNATFHNSLSGTAIKRITIPNHITTMAGYALQNCKLLESVTLPANQNFTTIPNYAFDGTESLTSITIPANVTTINDYAFRNSGITSITIPATVTTLGASTGLGFVFAGSKLREIIVQGTPTLQGNTGFGKYFQGCSDLVTVDIGKFVSNNTIPSGMFSGCTSLTDVSSIPDTVIDIGREAFAGCSAITAITLPSSLIYISREAFRGTSLTSITLPASLTSITFGAFDGTSIAKLDIPAGVGSLTMNSFKGMNSLRTLILRKSDGIVTLYAAMDPDLNTVMCRDYNQDLVIYVPDNLVDTYKGNANWQQVPNYQTRIKPLSALPAQ
jgi:hypothetical protein